MLLIAGSAFMRDRKVLGIKSAPPALRNDIERTGGDVMSTEEISKSAFGRLLNGQTAIDFYGQRRFGLIAALVVIVITVVSLCTQGLNLGLDFEGGNAWDVPASDTFGIDEAEQVLDANGISVAGGADPTSLVGFERRHHHPDRGDPGGSHDRAHAGLRRRGRRRGRRRSACRSPARRGVTEITEKAIRALVVFLVIVSLFITVRFEWRMAVAAFAAMAHDVIAVVGFYSVFQFEVTPATVVAFLTILGYSLYDTIVVFDRVKENDGKLAGARTPYEDVVNISMNQVLMRSLNTSISSILPVISLLVIGWGLLGARALEEFALALLIGMVVGRVLVDLHRHAAARLDARSRRHARCGGHG